MHREVATSAMLLASAVCGLLPALQARRIDLVQGLTEDSLAPVGGTMRTSTARARATIMAAQVAIACVMLIGAGLLGRSLLALIRIDRGYDPNNVLTARLPLPPRTTFAQHAPMLEAVLDRLRAVPGVTHVALGNALPLVSMGEFRAFTGPSPTDPAIQIQMQSLHRTVSPEYFAAMRLRLLEGRLLAESDTPASQPVLVVNRSFAAQYLGKNPVGQRLRSTIYNRSNCEVVGVVEDMKQGGIDVAGFTASSETAQPEMFSSYRQMGAMSPSSVILLARTTGDPSALAPTLRAIIRDEAPFLALESVMTMEDRLMSSLARPRTYAFVLGCFALFALAVAGAGLFGVLSYSVAQRTRELGVRTALGARTLDIVLLVLRQVAAILAIGLGTGLAVATLLAQSFGKVLYGIEPYDALTFIAVPIMIAAVAAFASAIPALRAGKVDPLAALRSY